MCVCMCVSGVWGGGGSGRECEINAQSNQVEKNNLQVQKVTKRMYGNREKIQFCKD